MKNLIFLFVLLTTIVSCSKESSSKQNDYSSSFNDSVRTIELALSDTSWTDLSSLLEMDSYVCLSSKIPIGRIERVLIENEKIYILDNQSRLICFKLNGEVAFFLDRKGRGPGEYLKITDFVINKGKNILTIADQGGRKLIHYSAKNGKYLNEEELRVSVSSMAFFNNEYYHYNPFHSNYPNDKSMYYSLLSSRNGKDITNRYFPHDPKIANYRFDDAFRQFSYNQDEVYFRKRFIDTIYAITNYGVKARYNFKLPDAMPYSLVQTKPDALELATKTKYSSTLYSIFKCGNILHANFFNQNLVASTFYDLEKDEIIYCGKHISPKPSISLPVYSLISGVYEDMFYSMVSPLTILEKVKKHPMVFSKGWLSINDNSNPVLVFYKLVR